MNAFNEAVNKYTVGHCVTILVDNVNDDGDSLRIDTFMIGDNGVVHSKIVNFFDSVSPLEYVSKYFATESGNGIYLSEIDLLEMNTNSNFTIQVDPRPVKILGYYYTKQMFEIRYMH